MSKLATILTSICSLFVAGLSLWYSVNAQAVDREYKEASIYPSLELTNVEYDYKFQLANVGPGPARVKNVVIAIDGRCLVVTPKARDEVLNLVHNMLGKSLPAVYALVAKTGITFPIQSRTVAIGDIIPAGYTLNLIGGVDTAVSELRSAAQKLANANDLMDASEANFASLYKNMDIFIEYCSLTGRTCNEVVSGRRCAP